MRAVLVNFQLEDKPRVYEPGAFVSCLTYSASGSIKGPPGICSMEEVSGNTSGVG